MAEIFVTRPMPGPGVQMLREAGHTVRTNDEDRALSREELLRGIAGADGVLTQLHDRVDAEFFDAAGPQLRVVANFGVGYNNINVDEATRRGVYVGNTPDVLSDATADIAWALILGAARRVSEGDRMMRAHDFHGFGPSFMLGGDIVGRTIAIVGAGRIGYEVARRAMGWRMRVLYVARSRHPEFDKDFNAEWVELDQALAEADFVSLHVPLSERTHHLIDAEKLALMKPTAYLINTARGPIVDEAALVRTLEERRIAGAGLDVYEDEPRMAEGLAECDNTLLLPHLGSATFGTRGAMNELAARNLLAVLAGETPPAAVNAEALGQPAG